MSRESFSTQKVVLLKDQSKKNREKVVQVFEYFGQGNVPAIVDMCSDECDWRHGGNASIIPFARPYRGKKGVYRFFQEIGHTISVNNISFSNFKSLGNEVMHDFHVEAIVIATGKPYIVDVVYIWTFDDTGKICKYRSPGDYTALEEAFCG